MDELIFPIIGSECNLPLYLVGVGYANQPHVIRPSGFPVYQVIYCSNGSGILRMNGKEYKITERQGFLLYPDIPHEYYPVFEPWETHWVTFDGNAVPALLPALGFEKSQVLYIHDIIRLAGLWDQIMLEAKSKSFQRGYHCSSLLYSFLIFLNCTVSGEPPVQDDSKFEQFYPVISYIDNHFNKLLSLDDLAERISVSPQYLCRLFKRYYNMRPFEYIAKRRIQEAKKLLLETESSIAEIAESCGYNEASYFCSIFKQYEKITPHEFKIFHRN